jgi:hemerythrin
MNAAHAEQEMIVWKEGNRVGVASFDGENHRLARLINRLYENMLSGHGQEIIPQVLYHLEASLNRHFAAEEAVLAGHAYSGLDEQRYQHQQFRMRIQEWERDYREGKPLLPADILIFLKDWWRDHVLGTDQEYIPFLKSRGVACRFWAGSCN